MNKLKSSKTKKEIKNKKTFDPAFKSSSTNWDFSVLSLTARKSAFAPMLFNAFTSAPFLNK
jgi:hypothetical protein